MRWDAYTFLRIYRILQKFAAPIGPLVVPWLVFFQMGCAGTTITINTPPAGSLVSPELYSVKLNKGYGLDKNGNGITDIPNTAVYVQRPIHTILNFTVVDALIPSVWPVPSGGNAGLGNTQGPWRWIFTPADVAQSAASLPTPQSSIPGAQSSNNNGILTMFTSTPVAELDLFDGTWAVQLARMPQNDLTGSPIYWDVANVEIKDYLIVQLGDSYSAGEGSPEKNDGQGIWADDGSGQHPRTPDYASCFSPLLHPPIHFTSAEEDCVRATAYGTTENWQNELGHRSSYTWGSLVAKAVEDWDTKTSVTYVNLAGTGARLTNLPTQQDGMPAVVIPPGFANAFDDATRQGDPSAVDAVTQAFPPYLDQAVPPQLPTLQTIIGPRKVDALLISMGGNDAGFANAIAGYIIREPDDDNYLAIIEGSIASGNWGPVGQHNFKSQHSGWHFPTDLPGLVGLPNAYASAAARSRRLASLPRMSTSSNIQIRW